MIRLAHDPLFDETAVSSRIQNLWMQLQAAHIEEDLERLRPYFSASLFQRKEAELRDAQRAGMIRAAVRPAILNWTMSYEGVERGKEKLVCRMLTRGRPLETRKSTGTVVSGGQETFFREEWTLTRPKGTLTPEAGTAVTVHCPGCGGTLSLYRSAVCPFCGKQVRVPDFTWTVDDINRQTELNP